jgi:uncharacterized protein YutE (UPF0331/DUF86 family)
MGNPEIDRDRVTGSLRLMSEDFQTLREKSRVSKEVYTSSRDFQAIIERRLQTATESAINIGNHFIARLGFGVPEDYAGVFQILGQKGILPLDLAQQMMEMARFRNLLLHVYWAIDHERVYDRLQERVTGLEEFVRCIGRWLKEHERA